MVNIPESSIPITENTGRVKLEWYNALRRVAENVLPELIILNQKEGFNVTLQPSSATLGGNLFELLAFNIANSVGTQIHVPTLPTATDQRTGFIIFGANDGTPRNAAAVTSFSEGAWTAGASHPANVRLETTASGSASRTERMRIGASGSPYFQGATTTASAANAFLNSASTPANELLRSTSSAKYKRDIEALEEPYADRVLELNPVWYRSKAQADNPDWSWYGLLAEDVARIDPRLVHWGYQSDDYEAVEVEDSSGSRIDYNLKLDAELKPDGVMYDRLSVLLLSVIKRQEKRIARLEEIASHYGIA